MRSIYYGRIHKSDFERKIIECLTDEDCSVSEVVRRLDRGGISAPSQAVRDRLDVLAHFKHIVKSENSKPHLFLFRKLDKEQNHDKS